MRAEKTLRGISRTYLVKYLSPCGGIVITLSPLLIPLSGDSSTDKQTNDRGISTLPNKFSKSPEAFFLLARAITKTFQLSFFCPHGPLRKHFSCVFSARMDLYENISEAFFLPARTFTKIFSKRCFCPHGPLRKYV